MVGCMLYLCVHTYVRIHMCVYVFMRCVNLC